MKNILDQSLDEYMETMKNISRRDIDTGQFNENQHQTNDRHQNERTTDISGKYKKKLGDLRHIKHDRDRKWYQKR